MQPETNVAIGLGCKRGCPAEAIVTLIARARAAAACEGVQARLFTHAAKQDERGLAQAARALGLPLIYLDAEVLRQVSLRSVTRSEKVTELFGLPSIAETAALAGAGPSSILLVSRMSEGGASCAIAATRDP